MNHYIVAQNHYRAWILFIAGLFLLFTAFAPAQTTGKTNTTKSTLEESEGEDIIGRERFIYERRAGGPNRTIPADGYTKAVTQHRALVQKYSAREAQSTKWQSVNPNGMFYQVTGANRISGRTTALAFHPSDANTFYIGAAGGGVWKTADGGTTFVPLTDNLPNLACGALAVDQVNPSVIYFGTGELHYSLDSHYGDGIYKSYDGGMTWKQVATTSIGTKFSAIVIDPTNSNVVYAAGSNGVYKSVDAGLTWTTTSSGANANSLVIDPTNTQILYTAVGGIGANTIKKTINGGGAWTTIMSGMTASNVGRTQLAIAPDNSSVLYAGIAKQYVNGVGAPLYAVFKTVNGGTNWTSQSTSPNYFGTQGWYDNAITIKPTDNTFIVVGGIDIYSSSNSGSTLTQRTVWSTASTSNFSHADIHCLQYRGTRLYCASDGGVFYSDDDGVTWTDLNISLSTLQFQSADYDPTNTQMIYGGCQDNYLQRTTNGGTQWTQYATGDGGYTVVDPVTTNIVYGQYVNGSIRRSINNGVSFTEIRPNGSTGGLFYNPYEMAPGDPNTIVFGRADVWKTTSASTATTASGWTQIATTATVGGSVSAIGISSTSIDKIYIGTNGGKILVTVNNGTNWSSQNLAQYVSDLAVDPADDNIAYATLGGYGSGTLLAGKVYKTINGGTNWSNITGNLPAIPVNSIVLKSSGTRTLFIGTDLGVYMSTDEGVTWVPFNYGLPTIPIFDLKFKEGNQILLAATHGRGCFTYNLNTASGPGIFISPTNLYFGNVNGTGTTKNVTVTNTGTSTLTISLAISDNSELTVTPTSASIAPAASATFAVKLAASAAGIRSGKVTLFHNAKDALSYVYGSGNGVAPFAAPVQLDVVFILDITGSTGVLLPQWVSQMPTIINNINNTFPNSRFGLASHLDYPFSPYGATGEYAYRLDAALNSNTATLMTQLNALTNGWGNDNPESQYEAIYQSLTGSGRDLDGNASYADPGDIAPSNMGYQPGNPTIIMHFTYPPEFHDRDTEPNYPYPGAQPVAGKTMTVNALLAQPAIYFGLITTAADKARTNVGTQAQLWKPTSSMVTNPMEELATITGGDIFNTDEDLSSLSAAIDSSLEIVSASTALYRTFSPESLLAKLKGKLLKPTKRGKGMPNIANLLDEVVLYGGFGANTSESDSAGGLRVGVSFMKSNCRMSIGGGDNPCTMWKAHPDSAKKYSWMRLTKWNFKKGTGSGYAELLATLEDRTGMHTGSARGLDSLFVKGKPAKKLVGEKRKLVPKDHNNHLLSELIALKINIAASQLEKTPLGFGELIYDEENSLNGLMIKEIARKADSALTFWRSEEWDHDLLDSVISKINRAFEGPIDAGDTISFAGTGRLKLKGEKTLYGISFLKASSVAPERIIAGRSNSEGEPEENEQSSQIEQQPDQFALYQAYPNPFNPTTTIRFALPMDARVTIKVFNTLGQELKVLFNNELLEIGVHAFEFNAGELPSGVYFYSIKAEGIEDKESGAVKETFLDVKKMMLLR